MSRELRLGALLLLTEELDGQLPLNRWRTVAYCGDIKLARGFGVTAEASIAMTLRELAQLDDQIDGALSEACTHDALGALARAAVL